MGDSTRRYRLIRDIGFKRYPERWIDDRPGLGREADDYPTDELERRAEQAGCDISKHIGIKLDDTNVLTCGQCALVCRIPTWRRIGEHCRSCREGGIVVRDVVVKTFEEAAEMRGGCIPSSPREKSPTLLPRRKDRPLLGRPHWKYRKKMKIVPRGSEEDGGQAVR